MIKFTPEKVTRLQANQIFVFGSNLRGIHGAGAAKIAHEKWGAEFGIGIGMTGRCYAIPTKDESLMSLAIWQIREHVQDFISFARVHPEFEFLVTKIGCGLAGYTVEEIAPLFGTNLPSNVVIPLEFDRVLSLD